MRSYLLDSPVSSLCRLSAEEVKTLVAGSKLFGEALSEGKLEHAFYFLQVFVDVSFFAVLAYFV